MKFIAKPSVLACAAIGLGCAGSVQAIDSFAPVVVTATRGPVPLAETVGDVSVIDAEQIMAAGQGSLIDLLRTVPGVEISSQGGPGQPATVFLRGSNSNHTAMLVDGVRLTSLNLGLGPLQAIPLGAIDRIEILRAPASGLYGADALGGVIQIFTRDHEQGGRLGLGMGQLGRQRIDLGAGGNADDLSWSFQLSGDRSQGFDAVLPNNFAHNADDDAHSQRAANLNLRYRLPNAGEVALSWLNTRNATDIDVDFPPFVSAPAARSVQTVDNLSLNGRYRFGSNWLSTLRLGQSRDRFRWLDTQSFDDTIRNRTDLLSWQNDIDMGAQLLRFGVEHQTQTLAADNTAYAERRRTTESALAGYQLAFGAQKIRADLRHDRTAGHAGETSGTLAYSWRLNPAWTLDGRWGKAYKLPSFNDLYYVDPWGYFLANPNLAPEIGRTLEFGLIHQTPASRATVYTFRSRISDLIANHDPDGFLGPLPGTVINTGMAAIEGVNAGADYRWDDWILRAAATWQNARDAASGERLPRRARLHGSVSLAREFGALRLTTELLGQSDRFDALPNQASGHLAGYVLANLHAAYRLDARWQLNLRWNNLFDREYVLAQGYPTPGRNLFADLNYRF